MREKMKLLIRQNKEQNERLMTVENMQREELFHNIHMIREFKHKLLYLQQLESVSQRNILKPPQPSPSMPVSPNMNTTSPLSSPSDTPSINNTPTNSPMTSRLHMPMPEIQELQSDSMIISSNPQNYTDDMGNNEKSSPQKSIDLTSESGHDSFKSSNPESESSRRRKTPGTYDPSWKNINQTIPLAFREKIDFTKISLRPGTPPNYVELARMEYEEAQRKWQQQQLEVLNYNQTHQHDNYLYSVSPCSPAFTEKIDLMDTISKLRKTSKFTSQADSSISPDVITDSFLEGGNRINSVSIQSSIPIQEVVSTSNPNVVYSVMSPSEMCVSPPPTPVPVHNPVVSGGKTSYDFLETPHSELDYQPFVNL
eukprot:TRINITY_DN5527_c0_g1_i2.p1 TRINITY_DN5527_c0_g1~~TRINITY_DN5527_c0_g1_i2.p1  ORF type:complete len:368 (-),score=101.63 TRINITY_DN5527_c0_g1_i2:10-1113(-)